MRRTAWARAKVEDLYVRLRTAEALGRPAAVAQELSCPCKRQRLAGD
ncbi:MAG: hypothetical protein WKG07_45015 [Hymenobacter sp.]